MLSLLYRFLSLGSIIASKSAAIESFCTQKNKSQSVKPKRELAMIAELGKCKSRRTKEKKMKNKKGVKFLISVASERARENERQ